MEGFGLGVPGLCQCTFDYIKSWSFCWSFNMEQNAPLLPPFVFFQVAFTMNSSSPWSSQIFFEIFLQQNYPRFLLEQKVHFPFTIIAKIPASSNGRHKHLTSQKKGRKDKILPRSLDTSPLQLSIRNDTPCLLATGVGPGRDSWQPRRMFFSSKHSKMPSKHKRQTVRGVCECRSRDMDVRGCR